MNREAYEAERIRGVHLSIVIVLSLGAIAIMLSGLTLSLAETWILPFLAIAVLVCWVFHIRQMFSPRIRLLVYAGVGYAMIVLDGVQPSAIFDFAISIVLAMTLFSQADNKGLLHLGLGLYLFLLARQVMLLATGRGIPVTGLVITELFIHTFIVIVIYMIAVNMVRRRVAEAETDAREIEALKEMQKRTEDFLTNVSHELRTPINAVTGIGGMMMREAKTRESAERASYIFSAGRRLSDQVEDMLDYTEIDTGKLVIAEEAYAVSSLVNDVVSECGFFEKEDAERITVEVAEGIPDRLLGGARWIKKLLLHQIENALQLSGGKDISVSIYAKPRDYGINLCMDVCHEGNGISRKTLAGILGGTFQQEEQEHRTVNTFDLGLRIIYGLTHAMGGFVRLGEGTEGGSGMHLRVSIPQRIAHDRKVSPEPVTSRTRLKVPHRDLMPLAESGKAGAMLPQGLIALVVDDEPMNLIVAEGILSGYGMVIDTAGSGKEAVEKVRNAWYDLIFMDHMMPEMDGVETAHIIRDILAAQERDTRIVALTANAVSGAREMFMREGFDGFVAKPIVRAELERTLKSISPGAHVAEASGKTWK